MRHRYHTFSNVRRTSDEARKFILIAINEHLGLFPRLNSKLSAQGGNIFSIAFATREELEGQHTIGLRNIDLQVGGVTPEHERFGRERWGECGHNIVHPVASEPVGFSDGIDSRAKDFVSPFGFVVSGKSRGIISTSFVAALFLRKQSVK